MRTEKSKGDRKGATGGRLQGGEKGVEREVGRGRESQKRGGRGGEGGFVERTEGRIAWYLVGGRGAAQRVKGGPLFRGPLGIFGGTRGCEVHAVAARPLIYIVGSGASASSLCFLAPPSWLPPAHACVHACARTHRFSSPGVDTRG